jgi:GH15 family glucan-1,4-alpha-glucosidase
VNPVTVAAGHDKSARPDSADWSKTGSPPIDDYALIGDCRTAALVARDGSIDWLCLPHFSGPSVFGRILDPVRGGSFVLRPRGRFAVQRHYLDRTPVLETTFETDRGRVWVIDFLTVLDGVRPMRPMRELARMIEGVSGEVQLEIAIDLRPGYARLRPRLECRGRMGWTWVWDNQIAVVRSDIAFARRGDTLEAEPFVSQGERASISLSYTKGDPAVFPMLGTDIQWRLEQTAGWWREWCDRCGYRGPHRNAVMQSAMVLRLLSHALSGAIVAAPTTSLPEAIGADRNWDYRFCWLRDAGLTAQALVGLGYRDEARAFLNWLLHATRLTWPELRVSMTSMAARL